jgi:hypothetical protein
MERCLREGAKVSALKHQGIAPVLDVGKLDTGALFVATEPPPGTTLRELAADLLDQRRALSIMRHVLEALAAAHEARLVHGALSPDDILITAAGRRERVTLRGFGLLAVSGAVSLGDARYLAPESALGHVDVRADLYAVGAILFELLCGHRPFFAEDPDSLRRQHAYAPPPTLQQRAPELRFVPALEELVAIALSKKPADRFQSASAMIDALDAAHQAVEVEAAAAVPPPAPRQSDDSLLILGRALMPDARPFEPPPSMPATMDRMVLPLPWWSRALRVLRRIASKVGIDRLARKVDDKLRISARLAKLDKRRRAAVFGAVGLLGIGLALLVVVRVARHPVESNDAAKLPDKGNAYIVQGDAHLAQGEYREAVAAYESALGSTPKPAPGRELITSLSRIAGSTDATSANAALDLLALQVGPAGYDAVVARASNAASADVRHHAIELAESAGVGDRVDRVASWTLDLKDATTCEQRRPIIAKLAAARDQRATAALRDPNVRKCVERQPVTNPKPVVSSRKRR